jgi:hypothetical protein
MGKYLPADVAKILDFDKNRYKKVSYGTAKTPSNTKLAHKIHYLTPH